MRQSSRSTIKNLRSKILKFQPRSLSILLCCLFLFTTIGGLAQIKRVWALGDGEKVFQDDEAHPDRNGNFTWDGQTIHLKGLYNEVMAFQVITEIGVEGAKAIEVEVRAPVNRVSNRSIGANTLKYGPDGTIEVFTEHYLHVKDSTPPNWYYGSAAARPKKMSGWIPDALIPSNATPGRGGFPVDIAFNADERSPENGSFRNQGFLIDIHLPRNRKDFPPGSYSGKVQVLQGGRIFVEIPLEITLLPQYLPDSNSRTVWAFSSDIDEYFPGMPPKEVEKMLKFEAHRHRIDMAGGFDVNTTPFRQEELDKYKPYLDGSAFTTANGYHGNGEGIGEKLFPIGVYGSPVMGKDRATVHQQADLWVDWFQKNAPGTKHFWYITDEPANTNRYNWVKERVGWIKSDKGPGSSLPIFTTKSYLKDSLGDITIWAGYDGVPLNELQGIRSRGGDHWFYNGNRPRYGSVILEGAAIDYRVNGWIMYKYDLRTWYLWQSTHWTHNGQGPKRHLHQEVFSNPLTFINDSLQYGNGDGILFYPGHMPFYPDEDRGLNSLLPSIRLKNIRRGQQDALIMEMAERKAGRERVLQIIERVVPRAMSEVPMDAPVPWSEKGDEYDRARNELLKLL